MFYSMSLRACKLCEYNIKCKNDKSCTSAVATATIWYMVQLGQKPNLWRLTRQEICSIDRETEQDTLSPSVPSIGLYITPIHVLIFKRI